LEVSTSWDPKGLRKPIKGLLYHIKKLKRQAIELVISNAIYHTLSVNVLSISVHYTNVEMDVGGCSVILNCYFGQSPAALLLIHSSSF